MNKKSAHKCLTCRFWGKVTHYHYRKCLKKSGGLGNVSTIGYDTCPAWELDEKRGRAMTDNVVTCVYCGHEYPEGTPTAKHDLLTAHIKICEKHPMRKAEQTIAKLRVALVEVPRWISVKDHMPEPYVTVLIITEEWLYPATGFRFDTYVQGPAWIRAGPYEEDYDAMRFFKERVTHWQSLPDDPE